MSWVSHAGDHYLSREKLSNHCSTEKGYVRLSESMANVYISGWKLCYRSEMYRKLGSNKDEISV